MTIIESNQTELANKVFVNSLQDLPTPTGNVIQLADNTTYEFANGTIDLEGNRIVLGLSNVLVGQDIFQTFLTSTGLPTGEIFISVVGDPNVNIYTFQSFTIQSLPTDTVAFDIDGAGLLILTTVSVQNSGAVGTFANINGFRANNLCQFGGNQSGIVFNGNFFAIIFHMVSFQSDAPGSTYVTISAGATIGFALTFGACYFIGDGSNTAINIDPTVTFLFTQNAPFTILGCSFLFVASAISGYTGTELQCKFRVNNGLQDTHLYGSYYLTTPSVNTIASSGVYEKMEGTTTDNDLRGFTHSDNRLTYTGESKTKFNVSANIYILPSALDMPTLSVAIAINGSVVVSTEINNEVTAMGKGIYISTDLITDLVINDYIEIWVANQSSSVSVLVSKANLVISEI